LVALFDWGVHRFDTGAGSAVGRSSAFTVTERLEGGSMRDLLDRGRRLSHSQALQVGLDICHALAEVHRHGLVHGELTPAKILFGADGQARLADLGAAGVLNSLAWAEPSGLDNHVASYASPEQATGSTAQASSDVYALSLMLVEALTGTIPFRTDSANTTLAARVDRLLPVTAELGPLATVLEHAARPDPLDRASAVEFGLELVAAAKRLPRPEPLPLTVAPPLPTPDDGAEPPVSVTEATAVAPPVESAAPSLPVPEQPEPAPVAAVEIHSPVSSDSAEQAPSAVAKGATRRRPRWAVPVAAALAVVVAVLVARWLLITPTHEVPVLAGRVEAEALNLITPFKWEVAIERERSDAAPEPGSVIRTAPVAGTTLAEGEALTMVVSEGPLLRELPEVTGIMESEAASALSTAGFEPFIESTPNEVIPAGEVISWSVPDDTTLVAGDEAEPGTRVIVVISSGPAPRTVPDLLGSIVGVARAQLVADGLRIEEADGVYSDEIPAGEILSQTPDPGAMLERGESVTVTVSLGPDVVTFPSLRAGMTFVEAQRLLIDAGFTVELSLGAADGVVESVAIDGEEPEVGGTYPRDTRVDVVAV
jgi:serine/threonine-protein kinase